MARKNKAYTFSLPTELFDQIQAHAEKSQKTTSGMIAEMIAAGLSGSVDYSPRLAIKTRLGGMLNVVGAQSSCSDDLFAELLADVRELEDEIRAWYGQKHEGTGEKAATSDDELTEDEINDIFG